MNKKDTETLRQNIDSVLAAAEEFNNQSTQLNNAKTSFTEHSERLQAMSIELGNIVKFCEELIDTTNKLIAESEKSAKSITAREEMLPGMIEEVKGTVASLVSSTSDLTGSVSALSENFKPLEKKVETAIWDSAALQKKVEVLIDDIGNLKKSILSYNSDIANLESKIEKAMDDTTLLNKSNTIIDGINKLDQKISKLQSTATAGLIFALIAALASVGMVVLNFIR